MNLPFLVSILVLSSFVGSLSAETRIMFCSDKGSTNRFDLYSMRADGSDLQAITATPTVSEWAPALSPDGKQLAYINRSTGSTFTGTLQIMPVTGGAATDVPTATSVLCVQWLDANTLVYMRRTNSSGFVGNYQLRRIKTDGTEDAQIYTNSFDVFMTGADSFHLDRATGRFHISDLVNAGQPATLLSGLVSGMAIDTTYTRCRDVDTGATQSLLVDHYDPAVSPDGTKLAFCADHGSGRHRLYVRGLGNDCATQLRLNDTFCGDPDWGPDSAWLAFTRATASSSGASPYIGNILRVSVSGGTATNLTGALTTVSGRCAHSLVYESAAAPVCNFSAVASITLTGNQVGISWPAVAGNRYQVQYSRDLAQWREDLPNSLLTAGAEEARLNFLDSPTDLASRFYRVRRLCP